MITPKLPCNVSNLPVRILAKSQSSTITTLQDLNKLELNNLMYWAT
jgi:hypothetical protein